VGAAKGVPLHPGGHTFLPSGGAASVNFEWRSPGHDWRVTEAPTAVQVEVAVAGGPVDVMLTHEAVSGATVKVERILRGNPLGFSPLALRNSAVSRRRVKRVWDAVRQRHPVHVAEQTAAPSQPPRVGSRHGYAQ